MPLGTKTLVMLSRIVAMSLVMTIVVVMAKATGVETIIIPMVAVAMTVVMSVMVAMPVI